MTAVPHPIGFGKYILLERISVGGMAEVYRARPFNAPGFQRFLALKRVLPNLAADPEFLSMFIDEAKIAVQLHHRNVCQIYELGRLGEAFYIVMEHIPGRDLLQIQKVLQQNKRIMSVSQALHITIELLEALDYAHRKTDDHGRPLGIVHRDVSPQNVLVSFDGEVKLIDFGIARAASKTQNTQVGVLKGKFAYMSPEQVNAGEVDARSDLFAVGVLLWEMLCGRRLFHGETDYETLEKVRSQPIEAPSVRNRRVPAEVDAVVERALTRNRDERFATAAEFAAALRAVEAAYPPPYTRAELSHWMCEQFRAELAVERTKVDEFARLITPDDVARHRKAMASSDVVALPDPENPGTPARAPIAPLPPIAGVEELLASNDEQPLATIMAQPGDGLPDLDAAAAAALRRTLATLPEPARLARRRRQRRWTLAAVVVLVVAALGTSAWLQASRRAATGVAVEVTADASHRTGPGTAAPVARVAVDGVALAGPPWLVRGLEPGRHEVTVEFEGFRPFKDSVEVASGTVATLAAALEPLPPALVRLTLEVEPAAARVSVAGVELEGSGASRAIDLPADGTTVVEVWAPRHVAESLTLPRDAGGTVTRTVKLRPLAGELTVTSEPDGVVWIDGIEVGPTSGGRVVRDLDPHRVHVVEVRPATPGFRPYRRDIVFDTYFEQHMRARLPRVGEPTTESSTPYGSLATGPTRVAYRVLIDGRDTGAATPIDEATPLPLKPGPRRVTFVHGAEVRNVLVTIVEGRTVFATPPTPTQP